jgi:methylmalonyl-CoA mutase N-terminal domain/subunit
MRRARALVPPRHKRTIQVSEYEKRIFEILAYVDEHGGTTRLIDEGWFQQEIADFSYETALRKHSGAKPLIGVNTLLDDAPDPKIETHSYDLGAAERQIARTQRVRRERDAAISIG